MMNALGEDALANSELDSAVIDKDNYLAKVSATFVKEKEAIIVYVNELVQFAAKTQNIDISGFSLEAEAKRPNKVKSIADVQLEVNRISVIVSHTLTHVD
jgi:hypothetical protein